MLSEAVAEFSRHDSAVIEMWGDDVIEYIQHKGVADPGNINEILHNYLDR
jgi:hypothetical protein